MRPKIIKVGIIFFYWPLVPWSLWDDWVWGWFALSESEGCDGE